MENQTKITILGILVIFSLLATSVFFIYLSGASSKYMEQLEKTDSFEECFNVCKQQDSFFFSSSDRTCVDSCDYKRILEAELK